MLVVISLENIKGRDFTKKLVKEKRAKFKIHRARPKKKNDWRRFQRRVEAPIVYPGKHTWIGLFQILTVSSFKRVEFLKSRFSKG